MLSKNSNIDIAALNNTSWNHLLHCEIRPNTEGTACLHTIQGTSTMSCLTPLPKSFKLNDSNIRRLKETIKPTVCSIIFIFFLFGMIVDCLFFFFYYFVCNELFYLIGNATLHHSVDTLCIKEWMLMGSCWWWGCNNSRIIKRYLNPLREKGAHNCSNKLNLS